MLEILGLKYEERARKALNPAAKAIFSLMAEKKTNLVLADDEIDTEKFLELADKIGPQIAILKTHVDILNDFSADIIDRMLELAKKHNFLIFEDSKFADIGNTVRLQYSEGLYKIADWANVVTVHVVTGPGIMQGMGSVIKEKKDKIPRGILILAQLSSEGNLAYGEYTKKAIEFANTNKDIVAGYIGNGGDLAQLEELVERAFAGHVILTPGIQMNSRKDSLGQRYTEPGEAISAGSDCLIVGRGIYSTEDPLKMAKKYREAGWKAYLKRTQKP